MADAKCIWADEMDKMPVQDRDAPGWHRSDGLDGQDGTCEMLKTRDAGEYGNEQITWSLQMRWKYGGEDGNSELERSCQPSRRSLSM